MGDKGVDQMIILKWMRKICQVLDRIKLIQYRIKWQGHKE
jgi:hypothetical protein